MKTICFSKWKNKINVYNVFSFPFQSFQLFSISYVSTLLFFLISLKKHFFQSLIFSISIFFNFQFFSTFNFFQLSIFFNFQFCLIILSFSFNSFQLQNFTFLIPNISIHNIDPSNLPFLMLPHRSIQPSIPHAPTSIHPTFHPSCSHIDPSNLPSLMLPS